MVALGLAARCLGQGFEARLPERQGPYSSALTEGLLEGDRVRGLRQRRVDLERVRGGEDRRAGVLQGAGSRAASPGVRLRHATRGVPPPRALRPSAHEVVAAGRREAADPTPDLGVPARVRLGRLVRALRLRLLVLRGARRGAAPPPEP